MSMQEELEGTRRLVFGLRKICSWAVETEGGGLIMRPPAQPPHGILCVNCSVMSLLCYLNDTPCQGIRDKCTSDGKCKECSHINECLFNKPCCWECKHILSCLEKERTPDAERYVRRRFKADWEEFKEAVRILSKSL
ncbi:hypothetical protein [Thermofilum sp.]|uniref:hypothetical protein n=1 Tax=Thermofilum sp. TaxID=1961369 RepID=UPI003160F319